MLRSKLIEKSRQKPTQFRWRSDKITRLEGFSDAVFAFAITLLVVSLEVPKTFDELLITMRGFAAFAICFVFLVGIWYSHYTFFRRYGIINPYTVSLNAILLFVVLFYVYPLKFLFTTLINALFGVTQVALADGTMVGIIKNYQMPTLMIIYDVGYIAVFMVFALLYIHAYRSKHKIKLNEIEISMTRESIQRKFIYIIFGIASIILASLGAVFESWKFNAAAGWIYALIGPVVGFHASRMEKSRQKLVK